MIEHLQISGFILAGGQSRRMGKDKRWIVVNGSPLLRHACRLLKSLMGENPTITGNNFDSDHYDDCPIIPDAVSGKGPLGGLVACLEHCKSPWAIVIPLDMPNLEQDDLQLLIDATHDDYDVILFDSGSDIQPLPALVNAKTFSYFRDHLESGNLSLQQNLKLLQVKSIALPNSDTKLFNLNTPADLDILAS